MTRKPIRISGPRGRRIIRDMLDGQYDLPELARRHRVTLADLAAWIDDPANQSLIRGTCVLADVQTQLLLSRFRLLAASRLIRLATDEQGNADITRRSCVDLLRLEMKRADLNGATQPEDSDVASLRDALYARLADEAAASVAPPGE